VRLGEALTRGAFLSNTSNKRVTSGLVPPSMQGSQEQDVSTQLLLLIIA
jgi:hypothetical protein